VRILRYGAHALLVECEDADAVAALYAELLRRRAEGALPPLDDLVPAERTLLIDGLEDPPALADTLRTLRSPAAGAPRGGSVEIAVRYDGPDLGEVAAAWDLRPEQAAAVHSGIGYRVAFCGFTPGFAYLTGLPARYHLPRRATPRTSVPPGAVAVAGPYTGVYPRSSPGGWHLIGSTDARLWDPSRDEPALLTPGTNVRFVDAAQL
jgi:KipI family sensor histidine kinase inhibitor